MSEEKKLNMPQSLLLLLLIIGSVAVCIRLKTGGPMIGLFFSWIIIYLFCKWLKIKYDHVVSGAYDAIRVVVPTLCLLMAIGVMIGTWLQSGTIATIIAGGLKLIDPTWLLPLTLVFCAVLSLVTGTSYGSVGSAGVAMMAIGNAMGINPGMVAGAVICGAMFGDKLSPLSDTTNLAPAVAGAKLNDHVRSMLWTTLPTFVISLVLFVILGISQTSGGYEEGNLLVYTEALQGEFKLGLVTLIPAAVIIALLLCKVNAIVSLGLSSVCAGAVAFFCQGATLLVGYITSLISCSQPMSHVLTGNMMKPLFKERKIAPEILSRSLEDAGTLSGPMIPWHGYCVYMAGTLGVAWSAFFPYLFLLYLTPFFSIFYGFTGISIRHVEDENEQKQG